MLIKYTIADDAPDDGEMLRPKTTYLYAVQWVKSRKGFVTFMNMEGYVTTVDIGFCNGVVAVLDGGRTMAVFT